MELKGRGFIFHSGQLSIATFNFSVEYHICQFIPLKSYDYLYDISIKINVATDEDSDRN